MANAPINGTGALLYGHTPILRFHGEGEETMTEQPRYYTDESACSCLDWLYRGRIRPCKHVVRVREAVVRVREANELLQLQEQHNERARHGQLR